MHVELALENTALMFYDLNVPFGVSQAELQKTLAFLSELGYNVAALDHTLAEKLPAEISCAIPEKLPFPIPASLRLLRRCTVILDDPSQNHRLTSLASHYDILALRPTNERVLQQACQSLDCDLISLDLSTRFPFYFKMKTLALALQRGIKIEICYAPGVLATDGGASRRNLISNATQLIRATRGRGIVISSEAKRALACRGPWDVVNLAAVWGLGQEKGLEAIGRESRSVIVQAEIRRRSFRGVIDVVYGGEKPATANTGRGNKEKPINNKRKADVLNDGPAASEAPEKPMSKRQQKKLAKQQEKENVSSTMPGKSPMELAELPIETASPAKNT